MKKRFVSLMLIAALFAVLLPALAAADTYYGTQYGYTDNGKTLNVRSSPSTGNNVIGALNYGTEVVVVKMYSNGWAQILWQQTASGEFSVAYVQRRFLVSSRPAPLPVQPTATPVPAGGTDYAQVFSPMNAEFKSAKQVKNPFVVYARPSRASGWVNLRWAPTTEAERIATCPQGKQLTVLAETKNWYQVKDPQTGMIGFISKQYVSVQ